MTSSRAWTSRRQSMPPEAIEKYGLWPDEALVFAVRSDSAAAVGRLETFGSMLRKGSLRAPSRAEGGRVAGALAVNP